MSSTQHFFDWKHITFFTYHLDVFEKVPHGGVILRSFRRLSKNSFNVTIVIRFPVEMLNDEEYLEFYQQLVEKTYSDYVKSDRFKPEKYEMANQMVHDLYVKYPNLR